MESTTGAAASEAGGLSGWAGTEGGPGGPPRGCHAARAEPCVAKRQRRGSASPPRSPPSSTGEGGAKQPPEHGAGSSGRRLASAAGPRVASVGDADNAVPLRGSCSRARDSGHGVERTPGPLAGRTRRHATERRVIGRTQPAVATRGGDNQARLPEGRRAGCGCEAATPRPRRGRGRRARGEGEGEGESPTRTKHRRGGERGRRRGKKTGGG